MQTQERNEIAVMNGAGPMVAAQPSMMALPPSTHPALALFLENSQQIMALANGFGRSGMFSANTPEQALAILMRGLELGLGPATAMSMFHVIKNKPCMDASGMVALCKAKRDVCEYFIVVESTRERAVYRTKRVGDPEPQEQVFTIQDAKDARLTGKDNWQLHTADMLCARASSKLARKVYPDLLFGLYTPDEIESIPTTDAPQPDAPPAGSKSAQLVAKLTGAAPPATTSPIRAAIERKQEAEAAFDAATMPIDAMSDAQVGEAITALRKEAKLGTAAWAEWLTEINTFNFTSIKGQSPEVARAVLVQLRSWCKHKLEEANAVAEAQAAGDAEPTTELVMTTQDDGDPFRDYPDEQEPAE